MDNIFITCDPSTSPVVGRVHNSYETAHMDDNHGFFVFTLVEFLRRFPIHIFEL